MTPYRVYIHVDLLEAIPARGAHRGRIMEFIRSLGSDPNRVGDYIDRDETLRERQVKIIGPYAITYWPDHAVQAVMIVSIRLADR